MTGLFSCEVIKAGFTELKIKGFQGPVFLPGTNGDELNRVLRRDPIIPITPLTVLFIYLLFKVQVTLLCHLEKCPFLNYGFPFTNNLTLSGVTSVLLI